MSKCLLDICLGESQFLAVLGDADLPVGIPVPYVEEYGVCGKIVDRIDDRIRVLGVFALDTCGSCRIRILDFVDVVGAELIVGVVACSLEILLEVLSGELPYGETSRSAVLRDVDAGRDFARPPPACADGALVVL